MDEMNEWRSGSKKVDQRAVQADFVGSGPNGVKISALFCFPISNKLLQK